MPFFDALCGAAADVAVKCHFLAVNVGGGYVGDKVVFKQEPIVKFLAVRLLHAAFKRIAVHNLFKAFKAEISVGGGAVLYGLYILAVSVVFAVKDRKSSRRVRMPQTAPQRNNMEDIII